ncbi:MAG: iron-sulfur cluster assembly scaffold protein [Acidobacteriota bacterium]|nr:iron-sulfur cluster assembly scaffold protein [Acidobacteriota bacterium]
MPKRLNPVCADRLRLSLQVQHGGLKPWRFLAYGCPPTLACGSVLTELIEEKTIAEVSYLTRKDILNAVGGLPCRRRCRGTRGTDGMPGKTSMARRICAWFSFAYVQDPDGYEIEIWNE